MAILVVKSKINKKSIKVLTKSICEILKCANKYEHTPVTTDKALKTLRKGVSIKNEVSHCTFWSK